ncbi:uncharacterized protein [Chelonus insularis]|uniref:uncharacterized protein n=1 Tax=Chelonus insularis TaxID=460826 RepID=UPI00158C7A57|nr:uncharacterized protein LOC118069280 [Chelonus insularis]
MYLLKVNFLAAFALIIFISTVKSQTSPDVRKFAMSLKYNLEKSLPSLLQNISALYQPLQLKDAEAATIYIYTLDATKSLLKVNSWQINPSVVKQKRESTVMTNMEDYINFIVGFIVNGLVFGLKALLTPVILLVQVLLLIVGILLNIILWILRALLATLLTDLGAGGLGTALSSILGDVQTSVDGILKDVEKLLGNLSLIQI